MKHRIFTVLYQDERGVDVTFSVDMTDERYAVVGIGSKDGKCRVAGFKLPQERFLTLVEMIAEAAGETAPESSVTSTGMMDNVSGPGDCLHGSPGAMSQHLNGGDGV